MKRRRRNKRRRNDTNPVSLARLRSRLSAASSDANAIGCSAGIPLPLSDRLTSSGTTRTTTGTLVFLHVQRGRRRANRSRALALCIYLDSLGRRRFLNVLRLAGEESIRPREKYWTLVAAGLIRSRARSSPRARRDGAPRWWALTVTAARWDKEFKVGEREVNNVSTAGMRHGLNYWENMYNNEYLNLQWTFNRFTHVDKI